jgi:hypothetical protein
MKERTASAPDITAGKSLQDFTIWLLLALIVGVYLRMVAASMGFNFDVESYRIVADIVMSGGNVYAETTRYNYGPIWFHLLNGLDAIPWDDPDPFWSLRWKVMIFLTVVDTLLALLLLRWFGWRAALLFWLNPIAILITGYHSQFDNVAVLLGLLGAGLLQSNWKMPLVRHLPGLAIIGLSLMLKHIFFLFPLWLAFKQDTLRRKLVYVAVPFGIFALGFLPYLDGAGADGILRNVLLYRSFNNAPFWYGVGPYVIIEKLPLILLFIGSLAFAGLLWRKLDPVESALRYTLVLVLFSSAVANQYLAIPLAAIAVNWNLFYALYSVLGGAYLVASKDGLQWPAPVEGVYYDELLFVMFLGLLVHVSSTATMARVAESIKDGWRWLKGEMLLQCGSKQDEP